MSPALCDFAFSPYGARASQGKSGSFRATLVLWLLLYLIDLRVIFPGWPNLTCATWRTKLIKEFGVYRLVFIPLGRDIIFVIDGLNWADRLARATVDTFIRLDIEHTFALIDAINRTFFDT